MTLGDVGQLERVLGREVRKRVHLQMGPSGFHGIELRRVGRKEFDVEAARPVEHSGHRPTSVHVEPIPHEKDRTLDLTPEVSNELGQPYAVDVATGPDRKVERDPTSPGRHRQRPDDRSLFSVTSRLRKNRCLSSRGPRPAHERREQQPALIEENDVRVQPPGFFLMRGQSTLTQRRIAASSRSRACRSGF